MFISCLCTEAVRLRLHEFNRCLSLSHILPLVQHCELILFSLLPMFYLFFFLFLNTLLLFLFVSVLHFATLCLVLFCLFRRPSSPLNFLLCVLAPCPQRAVLPLPNVHGLAEAAEPAGSARLGALCAAPQAGPRLRRSLPGLQLLFSFGLRPHRRLPGRKRFLQVFLKNFSPQ